MRAHRREIVAGALPSLRANGSRECAPDDRLREAIQITNTKVNGLLRRVAPRNDGLGLRRRDPRQMNRTAERLLHQIEAIDEHA